MPTDSEHPHHNGNAAATAGTDAAATPTETPEFQRELAGLDQLEIATAPEASRLSRLWTAWWPGLTALLIGLFLWQCVVWSGWKPDYVLPAPKDVIKDLWRRELLDATWITMKRAAIGYGLAVVIGTVIGVAMSQVSVLRRAFGSFITGLQTMPSIAWFPLAIVLFKPSEAAIQFVVVLGAAPSIANGLLSGVDNLPPLWLRAGRVLGARGLSLVWNVTLPGALPSYVAGLKQGWAFSWRSLMAGELLLTIPGVASIGALLDRDRTLGDYVSMQSTMLLILIIGIVVDRLVFAKIETTMARRRGLIDA